MSRRIVRTIFGTAAAGAVIAALGLTTAGTAHAATGRVQGIYANRSAGYDHYAGYDTAYNNNWLFRYVVTTVPVKACRIAPDKNPAAVVQLWPPWSARTPRSSPSSTATRSSSSKPGA
jgi:hypothetical protein